MTPTFKTPGVTLHGPDENGPQAAAFTPGLVWQVSVWPDNQIQVSARVSEGVRLTIDTGQRRSQLESISVLTNAWRIHHMPDEPREDVIQAVLWGFAVHEAERKTP